MAARGIPWIPEFRIAIIFIVCQKVLFRIKLSEVCGRPGIRCNCFMGEFSWLLSVRWRVQGKIPGMPGVRRTSYILWEISGGPGDTGYAFGLGIQCMPKGDLCREGFLFLPCNN
jgi:hypothetical protein